MAWPAAAWSTALQRCRGGVVGCGQAKACQQRHGGRIGGVSHLLHLWSAWAGMLHVSITLSWMAVEVEVKAWMAMSAAVVSSLEASTLNLTVSFYYAMMMRVKIQPFLGRCRRCY